MELVLSTVELLELVLLKVDDLRSILTAASRVCRFWNQLIRESPSLQKLLFFRPDTSCTENKQLQRSPRINTLLSRHSHGVLACISEEAYQSVSYSPYNSPHNLEASWCRMLVQQPPARKLGFWRVEIDSSSEHGYEITTRMLDLNEEGGMPMGMLVEFMAQLGNGLPWTLYWGDEGMEYLEKEKNSLFIRKTQPSKRAKLFRMWQDSDIVVKFSR